MAYKGTLSSAVAFDVKYRCGSSATGNAGITVMFIIQSDKFSDVDTFTCAMNAGAETVKTYAPAALLGGKRTRVIIQVDTTDGSPGNLAVVQGQNTVSGQVVGDGRWVFDLT